MSLNSCERKGIALNVRAGASGFMQGHVLYPQALLEKIMPGTPEAMRNNDGVREGDQERQKRCSHRDGVSGISVKGPCCQ